MYQKLVENKNCKNVVYENWRVALDTIIDSFLGQQMLQNTITNQYRI